MHPDSAVNVDNIIAHDFTMFNYLYPAIHSSHSSDKTPDIVIHIHHLVHSS